MTFTVWPGGESGFFTALAGHIALALEVDYVIIARLVGPSHERVQTVAVRVEGEPAENVEWTRQGTLLEEALNTRLWICAEAQSYDGLHPSLRGVLINASFVLPLRDSTSTVIGFIVALNRLPLTQIHALSATLSVFGERAAAELDRTQSHEENRRLVADLGHRVRDLTMLHDVMRIVQRDELSTNDWLREIVHATARWWPHSTTVSVLARAGDFEVATGVADLPLIHHVEFKLADERSGAIDIRCASASAGGEQPSSSRVLENVADMFRTAVDRRRAITALRQSERRYRSVVEHQSDLVCRYKPDTTLTFVNDAYCRFFGKRREELLGRHFIELIPEGDRHAALAHVTSLLDGREPQVDEHNVLMPNGMIGRQQWIDDVVLADDGTIEELQGIGRDITDRWRAEEALRHKEASLREAYERIRSLAHRLIVAQESERTEIARDLHDDVSQQLAALGIGLSLVEAQLKADPANKLEVARLREMATGLADKVRHVSHALHPGVLQHAGLSAAIASHCEAVAAQHTFLVTFESRGTFNDIDRDVALCLYRAVQQGLRNVAMHASASRAAVSLSRAGAELQLTITDNGRGFDPSKTRTRGLGLLSIEERVHLANGNFLITSRPGGGTRVTIKVPCNWV